MKKLVVLALAGFFALSVYAPSLSYAKKGGEPAVKASDMAKGHTAGKGEKKADVKKQGGKKKGEVNKATPAEKAIPTPGTPGATKAVPAIPAVPAKK